MTLSRRKFLKTGMSVATASVFWTASPMRSYAQSAQVDEDKLMIAGPLGEKTLGAPDAKVTVVEYASMTCGHCANFHNTTFKLLKEKYIDTGQVQFVFREFPLDPVAAAVFMLARCVPKERYFDVIETFFRTQQDWAFTENPVEALKKMALQIGLSQQEFQDCLTNQELLDGVNWVRKRAMEEFQVSSTPTFFFNGKREVGALSIEQVDKILGAML